MKLSLAVGILSQALPVVSETKLSAWLESRRRSEEGTLDAKVKLSTFLSSAGGSKFKQGRALKRSSSTQINDKKKSRQLVNSRSRSASGVGETPVCDPTSTDPDVGILSCGPKAKCKPDKGSVLGGFCVGSALSSRHGDLKKESKVKNLAKLQPNKAGSRKLKNTSSKNSVKNLCDPFSSDPDTGILSCGTGRRCQASKTSSLGGECKDVGTRPRLTNPGALRNSRGKPAVKAVECVPVGADVGVLECGVGQVCVESTESSLGGICSSPTSRHLQTAADLGLCDPTSYMYGYYDCDCSAFNNATKTGVVSCLKESTCLGSVFYGCYDTCLNTTSTYTFLDNTVISSNGCYEFEVDGDAATSTLCLKFPPDFTSCAAVLDGQACGSCTIDDGYLSFDCTNVENGFSFGPGDSFASFPVIQACYQPVNGQYCSVCSYGFQIPYDDTTPISLGGFGDSFTCSGLYAASIFNQISVEKCPEASALANAECCVYQCDICKSRYLDYVTAYDPLYVAGFGNTTCSEVYTAGYVNNSIPQDSCPSLRESIGDACCTGEYSYSCDICGFGSSITSDKYDLQVYASGLGNVTCGDVSNSAYNASVFDSETCPAAAGSVNGTCCTDFVPTYFCDICGPGSYITYDKYDLSVYAPGLGNVTCLDIGNAAYAYYEGGFDLETCPVVAGIVNGTCCTDSVPSCYNICGYSGTIQPSSFNTTVTVPGLGNYTCYDLYLSVYAGGNFSLSNDTCALREAGSSTCCEAAGPYPECLICGDGGIAAPDATFFVEGYPIPCDYLGFVAEAGYFNETECGYISSLAGPSCCAGSIIPSAAPVDMS